MYGAEKPRRVSLPTYSFAKERYWVDTPAGGPAAASPVATSVLHPLLHRNTSDLRQQRFSSTFTGEEFFLTDHRMRTNGYGGHKVLPAVAYLEMARAAVEQALPDRPEAGVLELRDMVWLKPLIVARPTQVEIALSYAEDGRVEYEIFSVDGDQETVYCQGHAVLEHSAKPPRLRLDDLRAEMNEGRLESSDVYALTSRLGFDYGPAHRGVTAIHLGERQLLAALRLPVHVETNREEYVLHPSVMDSALQAAIGLIVDPDHAPAGPILPFAVRSVRISSACQKEMFAWVRYASDSKQGDRSVELDIDLCAPDGMVCIQMRGFASRLLELPSTDTRGQEAMFDDAHYEKVIADLVKGAISVDDATELN
jgi:acyl transferase domain-containing protein